MVDEEKIGEQGVTEETYASMLSEAIKQKDAEINSMKSAHAKQVQELTNAILNGEGKEGEDEPKQDLVVSRKDALKLYQENNFNTDLEYWKNFLDLRDATIREYGRDPLVTGNYGLDQEGNKVSPEYGEAEAMNLLCENMRKLIEQANGDPQVFHMLLQAEQK